MAFLQLVKGALPALVRAQRRRAVIGRSAECEVPLDVPAVSRRHAAVSRDRRPVLRRRPAKPQRHVLNDASDSAIAPLRDGDQLVICDQEFRFHSGHAAAGMSTPCATVEHRAVASWSTTRTERQRPA